MAEYRVVDADQSDDLQAFSQYLWQQQIPHRRMIAGTRQWLLVSQQDQARFVSDAYQRWCQGEPLPDWQGGPVRPVQPVARLLTAMAETPVTFLLFALSVAGFLIVTFDRQLGWLQWLTYYQQFPYPRSLQPLTPDDQWWRVITPVFLHFGWLHITFNMLWLFELGRRVERVQGSLSLLGITMSIGLAGNVAQSWYTNVGIFGGMSGVIYGLLGYSWIWSVWRRDQRLVVPPPVLYFMLGSLVFFMLGFSELLGIGKVANAAHLGGLIMGLILGGLAAWLDQCLRR